ncbi:MAG TPA: 4-hydroxybenzoate octaprenyltransferase, partial [Thiothrix sp.]|nr:4-hydroxybenzoate octaprenyltransferase [Thiothrix sp.]
SAGCAVNDFADRKIDPHVERTKNRPLASGKLSSKEALLLFFVLGIAAFLLVIQLNKITLLLSIGAIILAASYPFMKRYHSLPQVHLGIAFAWSVPMAYSAVTGSLPTLAGWLIFVATVLWTIAYDTMYALTDKPDDLKIGVKSTAILFGEKNRLIIGVFQLLMLFTLLSVGLLSGLGGAYYSALIVSAVFMGYQHYLLSQSETENGLPAFLNNNWVGMIIFMGILLDYAY